MRRIARRGWRQLALLAVILLAFSFLANQLYALQVGQSPDQAKTLQQYYTQDVAAPQTEKPPRGTIVDVNGNDLVSTVTVYKLAAAPPYIPLKKKPKVAQVLADVLFPVRLPSGKLAHNQQAIAKAKDKYLLHYNQFLTQLSTTWNYVCLAGSDSPTCPFPADISRTTANTIVNRINNLGVSGISLESHSQPTYPNGSLGSQLLGYVAYQYPANSQPIDTGQFGVEHYYDNLLTGVPGHTSVRIDTHGNTIRVGNGSDTAPQPGATLRLTLDAYVQLLAERDLAKIVKSQGATGGSIIIERPSDGAILAMASSPTYDPNNWRALVNQLAKKAGIGTKHYNADKFNQAIFNVFPNAAVSKQYEPGSTFKSITIAIGFDAGYFNENTTVNDAGVLNYQGIPIMNWCLSSCVFGGAENPSKMLHYSSNIGAAQFGEKIPVIPWYHYVLDNFGFGQRTGVDLSDEIAGDIRQQNDKPPKPIWVPIDKLTQAYGQGLSITPLQLVNAYAALANGGMLPHPHVLQSYTVAGKTTTPSWPALHRAVSQDTSDRMKQLLLQQAVHGEACKALVPGYDIAAKTGTASIPSLGGNYYRNSTIASTAAFGPVGADLSQQFVVLVKVDKPATQWGSTVAAPVVHDIYQHLFDYYKIPPASNPVQPKQMCSYPADKP
ncbi:MAG: Peptidoglycan glycosyltransferase [Chloroflexi bacterium]|nr:Peptidoglycan glycosyltransferase [Chloroflexota bacterium]